MATSFLILSALVLLLQGAVGAVNGAGALNPTPFDFLSEESRLYHNLTRNYNKYVRPVHNATHIVKVNLSVALIQILNFDEAQQRLDTLVWLYKAWNDAALKWNPEEFSGLEALRMPHEVIWKPDIVLYNSMSDKWEYPGHPLAIVQSTGNVLFVPPMQLHSSCHMDLSKFPFDEQQCRLTMGSWTYSSLQVDLDFYDKPQLDMSTFVPSSEWSVTENWAKKNKKKYECCPEIHLDITFTLKLKRHLGPYTHTLVAPSVVLAFLIPVVFLLPTGSGEKTFLGIGVLIGLVLMALVLGETIPRASHTVPIIVMYNLACVVLTAVCLMFAAIVNTAWSQTGDVSGVLKILFLTVLGRVLCVPEEPYTRYTEDENIVTDATNPSRAASGWRRLSRVIDRLCLIVFFLVVIIMTIAMLS